MLALTRRGFGESDKPETGYDLSTLAEDVRQFLDAMKIKRVNLVGHSAGGNELIQFATVYPGRVLKLIFLEAAYDRREVFTFEAKDPLLAASSAKDPPPVLSLKEKIQAEYFKYMDEFKPDFKKIKAPALSFYAILKHTGHSSLMPTKPRAKRRKIS